MIFLSIYFLQKKLNLTFLLILNNNFRYFSLICFVGFLKLVKRIIWSLIGTQVEDFVFNTEISFPPYWRGQAETL